MDGKRGWYVVLGTFLAMAITAGASMFVLPVMLEKIMDETKWSLTEISSSVTVFCLAAAVASPLAGQLVVKFGARPVMLGGIAIGALSSWLTAYVHVLWQFYAVVLLGAIGSVASTYVPVASVVARWFVKHRGIATGLAMLSIFIGAAAFTIGTNELLAHQTWREVYKLYAFAWLVAAVPTWIWVRNPDPAEENAYLASIDNHLTTQDDLTLQQALRTRSFWGLSIGDAITGLVFAVFNVHLVLYLTKDLGNADVAASAVGLLNLTQAGGTLLFGVLGDRFRLRPVFVSCYFFPFIAVPLLMIGGHPALAYAFALMAGIPGGGRNALFPVTLVYCFGESNIGAIYGLSNSFFMTGNAFAAVISAQIYERTGSTRAVYSVCMVLLVVSTILVSLIQRKPTKT